MSQTLDLGGSDIYCNSVNVGATGPGLQGTISTISQAEIGVLDAVTPGTAAASKAVVLNSSKGISTITSATITTLTSTTANIADVVAPANLTLNATGTGTIGIGSVSTGAVTITPALNVTGAVAFTKPSRCTTATALAATGNAALDPTLGEVFTLTPTGSQNITASSAPVGARVFIVVTTSGGSSFTQTFTTNFKTTGTLATGTVTGKVFTLTFIGDGTNLNEIARTTAM